MALTKKASLMILLLQLLSLSKEAPVRELV